MRTQIIIVNYRTPELTADCLQSLLDESIIDENTRVSLVDNCSNDGSVEQLEQLIRVNDWWSWIDWIPLEHNGGFAFGNNAAIRRCFESDDRPDFIWLLNPDTIVRQGALENLIHFLRENANVGIVGSRLEDPDATPQRSAFRFPTLVSEIDSALRFGPISRCFASYVVAPPVSDESGLAQWVAGASMLVRREVFEQIGLLDEKYFMYYEEVDFCYQAAQAGWSCAYEPASRVVHLVGQASGVTDRKAVPNRRPKYWFDSRRRYFCKNYGGFYAGVADALWSMCYCVWRLRSWVQRKRPSEPPHYLYDFLRNSVLVRGIAR